MEPNKIEKTKRVLIAGGSGFVGEHLRRLFVSHYYEVYLLSTQKELSTQQHIIYWLPSKNKIDLKEHNTFDVIVNLAGAGIADKLWTNKRKEELKNSRIESTMFLKEMIHNGTLKSSYFVQASAIGFYGDRGYEKLTEESTRGEGFLSLLTEQWEASISGLQIPYSIARIGIVFHPDAGAFPKLIMGLRFKFMVIFGKGRQYISWIDIRDLCELILFLSHKRLTGTFNAVSPQPVQFMYLLKKFNQKFGGISIPLTVPAFLLKLFIGNMSEVFLNSQKVSCRKIENLGFTFQSKTLALFFKSYKKRF